MSLVAREAGLSKGGLLHHFATRNDLIWIADLVPKFDPAASTQERTTQSAAFVVRHRADGTLLGFFVAQDSDALPAGAMLNGRLDWKLLKHDAKRLLQAFGS